MAADTQVADTQVVGVAADTQVADTQVVGVAAATTGDGSLILPRVSRSNPSITMKQLTEQGSMVADLLDSRVLVRVKPVNVPLRQI